MFFRSTFLKLKIKYLIVIIAVCFIIRILGVFTHLFEQDYYKTFEYPYNGNIHISVQQLRFNQKPDIPPINFYNYEYIIDCHEKCTTDGNVVPLRLVYIVKSSPENFDRRVVIRNTWGYEHRFSDVEIRTVFVLGTRNDRELQEIINNESAQFKDIVQANFTDMYFNNTIKTMMGLKWAVKFCSASKFYMFVDDDYYVSTKNILRFIRNPANYPQYLEDSNRKTKNDSVIHQTQIEDFELPDDVRLYAGYVFFSAPHRHFTSKWYVSLEEYPYHMWPPYVTAGAYILSLEALMDMYYTSFYTQHFRFDDVYLGLLAKKADIEPFHCDHFYFYKNPYESQGYRFTIASHGYDSPAELLQVWTDQKSLGNA